MPPKGKVKARKPVAGKPAPKDKTKAAVDAGEVEESKSKLNGQLLTLYGAVGVLVLLVILLVLKQTGHLF